MIKKIKILGRDNVGWSIDKDRQNIEYFVSKINNVKLVNNFFRANLLFFVWYNQVYRLRYLLLWYKKILNKRIIAVITNDITGYYDKFSKLKNIVNFWVSPNNKVSKFLDNNKADYFQIPFYVSPKIFYPINEDKEKITKKLGIDYESIRNKILIGSFQRDSLGSDLNKPKWQKNPDLLINIMKELGRERFVLVLAGPRRHYIISQCKKNNINYIFLGDYSFIEKNEDDLKNNNLEDKKINLLYNLIDFYIVSSKSEGGPKAIIESLLTKTRIFSTRVGLSEDFLLENELYSEDNFSNIITQINNFKDMDEKNFYIRCDKIRDYFSLNNFLLNYSNMFKEIYES